MPREGPFQPPNPCGLEGWAAGKPAPAARLFYRALHSARQLSSMRLEKPHSLSYQASTLSMRPLVRVWLASKIDDSGLWLKSHDTSGRAL
ncbi:hypothetical protein D3C80_1998090 [compost metagenome]